MRQAWRLIGRVLVNTVFVGIPLALGACSPPTEPGARVLVHRLTRPEATDAVRLNEDLVFHFSGEVDRSSVTHDSVRVTSSDGTPARGRLVVNGTRVRFVPATVLAPDLSDGGYTPDTRYRVEIAGFPRPDCLRGLDGAPLAATYSFEFHTVAVGAGPAFEDPDPDRVRPLRLFPAPQPAPFGGPELHYEIAPSDSIYLRCDEALDPATLIDGAFALRPRRGPEVALRTRLIENEPDAALRPRPVRAHSSVAAEVWQREPRAALVELTPATRLTGGDSNPWRLVFRPEVRTLQVITRAFAPGWPALPIVLPGDRSGMPRDLGGRPVWEPALVLVLVSVVDRGRDAGRGAWLEEFVDTQLRSTIAVPGCDGTATWSDTGRVEFRFPRSAGDGRHGQVELVGPETRRDIHALRIEVPVGATCRLDSGPGPVVLRTQGSMHIRGRLERSTSSRSTMTFQREALSTWLERALALPAAAAAHDADWTVLVAGGDLFIEGDIDVSTPLLLVAGGRIRVTGTVRSADPTQVFRLGEGGGAGLMASNVEDLEIDPPETNPLRETLRFAVLSGPLPTRGSVLAWSEADARGSIQREGGRGGRWSVRYVSELDLPPLVPEDLNAVDSPELLARPGSIQFLVELVVEPGGLWRPPFVDSVRLVWQEPEGGER